MVKGEEKFMVKSYKKKIRYFIPLFLAAGISIYTAFLVVPIFNSMILSFYSGSGMTPSEFIGFGNYIILADANHICKVRFKLY